MKKGLFNTLQNRVTTMAMKMAKGFKRKHKLTGKSLNVKRIVEASTGRRAMMLLDSSGHLLALVFILALMMLLKVEPAKLHLLLEDMALIGSLCSILLMHFTAGLLVWVFWKILWMIVAPSELVTSVWNFANHLF